jgi:hypothetical protein
VPKRVPIHMSSQNHLEQTVGFSKFHFHVDCQR